jgi:hypothetical protein
MDQCPRSSVEEQRSRKARAQVRFLPGALLHARRRQRCYLPRGEDVGESRDGQHPGLTVRTRARDRYGVR